MATKALERGSARARAAGAALWAPVIDRTSPLPVSRQLAAALRAAIAEGQLGAGARLPSTRGLAAEIGLARSTVVAVFEQLAAEGYLLAQPGSGISCRPGSPQSMRMRMPMPGPGPSRAAVGKSRHRRRG